MLVEIEANAVKFNKSGRRKQDKKYTNLKKARTKQMEQLHLGKLDLRTFMVSVGSMTFHGDDRIHRIPPSDPDEKSNNDGVKSQEEHESVRAKKSNKKNQKKSERLNRPGSLTKEAGMVVAKKRLEELNFILSPSQPDTLGEFF